MLVSSRLNLLAILFLVIFALFSCVWVAFGAFALIDVALSETLTVWGFLIIESFVALGPVFFTGGLYLQLQMARRDTEHIVGAVEAGTRSTAGP